MPFRTILLFLVVTSSTVFTPLPDDLDHLSFEGSITDIHGAAIAGVRVTAQHAAGLVRLTTTNDQGRYKLSRLTPGIYQLRADAPGFRTSICEAVSGGSGATIRRDFQLLPGILEAVVTIDGTPPGGTLDTQRTVVGATFSESEVDDLPTPSRNPFDLLFSLPGVMEPAFSTALLAEGDASDAFRSAPEESGNFSLNGGTPFSNNLTIEGFDNNDDRAARERFTPSLDAVQEVQVIANQFSAEYGRASGGRVNLKLRSGADSLHGRASWNLRDARFNANSYTRNADPSRGFRIPFTENTLSASVGGPLPVSFLSFFSTYEYLNTSDHSEIAAILPTETNPRFPLPLPTGANLGSTGVDRLGRPVTVNGGASVGLYDLLVSTPRSTHALQSRVDLAGGRRHSGFALVTLARMRDQRSFPGGRRTLDTMRSSGRDSLSAAVSHTFVASTRALMETRWQYSRLTPADSTGSDRPVVLIETDDPRDVPTTENSLSRTGNLLTGSSNSSGVDRHEQRNQVQHNLSYSLGNHQLRLGLDLQLIRSRYADLEDTTGTFTFASPADFLANKFSRFRQRFKTTSSIHNEYAGVYIQDDWRVRPGLTISGGVRWDNETALRDRNNFGPRFAFAYDPTSRGRVVVRGGFGSFYNRVLLRTLDDFRLTSGSLLIDTNLEAAGSLLESLQFPKVLSATDPVVAQFSVRETRFLRRTETGLRIPESHQASIGFEVSTRGNGVLEVTYVHNRGAHLWRESNVNAPRLPAGFKNASSYLLSRDFDNTRDPVSGLRPITSTGNADFVRFDVSQTSSKTIESNGKRIVVFGLDNQSTSNSTSVIRAALAALRSLRPHPDFEQIEELQSRGNSSYHGLTVSFTRSSRGSHFRVAYTLSRLIDDGVVNTSSPLIAGDFRRERSLSLLDARHRVAAGASHQLPSWLGALQVAATVSVNSARPFSIGINGNDRNLDDVSNDRPQFAGLEQSIGWHKPGTALNGNLHAAFSLPLIGTSGNLARNAGRGPWQHALNARLSRRIQVSESVRVTPIVDVFNPLNATVFSFGAEYVDFTPANAVSFLTPARTLRPRTLRVGLRVEF